MKTFLLVALMALCAASLSYAKDPVAECLEKCRGNADCAGHCTIEKARNQSSGIVPQQLDDPVEERHNIHSRDDSAKVVPPGVR